MAVELDHQLHREVVLSLVNFVDGLEFHVARLSLLLVLHCIPVYRTMGFLRKQKTHLGNRSTI